MIVVVCYLLVVACGSLIVARCLFCWLLVFVVYWLFFVV